MLFSSNVFLFLFFPAALIGYYIIHTKNLRNLFLLTASILFYTWGAGKFVFVMLGVIFFTYRMALGIDNYRDNKVLTKVMLIFAVVGNLTVLSYYKYYDFAVGALNRFVLPLFSVDLPLKNITLPIGISFFIFQAISYVIDVYRGTVQVQKRFINIALYISFFPQLIAGPIVRYSDINTQIDRRKETLNDFNIGVRRFIMGFGKKMLLANNMALIADKAFAMPDIERSVAFAWFGAVAYSFQILFDFSGYSDMAIGLGRMFGFHFLENFNYPYISKSVSEFWRRWHISLGSWFRDYVYFSLGGSRVKSTFRLVANLLIVWALTGLWHGASWHFVIWGLLYFVLIAFEKVTKLPKKLMTSPAMGLYRAFTLLAVCIGWVLFRANGLKNAIKYILGMIGLCDNPLICVNTMVALREYWFFLIFSVLCSTPVFKITKERLEQKNVIVNIVINVASTVF